MIDRDAHLDNAKGVLILLVVIGHLFWPVPADSAADQALYTWIYAFHMPTFALISGYLSSAEMNGARFGKLCRTILLPFIVFSGIHAGLQALYDHPINPAVPLFGLWYLLSLFFWRALLPVFQSREALAAAIVLSLLCGWFDWLGLTLSGSRTLALFPIFLLGYQLRTQRRPLTRMLSKRHAFPALAAAAVLFYTAAVYLPPINPLLYHTHSYEALSVSAFGGATMRATTLAIAVMCGLSLLSLVPARVGLLTHLGKHSMAIYLLHSPLLLIYREHSDLYRPVNDLPTAALVAVGVAVALVLSSAPVTAAIQRLARANLLWRSAGKTAQNEREAA